jgi:Raf kinase inhibitor-like YbhB/YbcL family protein
MRAIFFLAALIALASCGGSDRLERDPDVGASARVRVESVFEDGDEMPIEFTCDGDDVSPPITWTAVTGAEEYALIFTDLDAPGGTYVHWVVFGIPGSVHELERGKLPDGAIEGENSFGDTGYGGPCPPPGEDPHQYDLIVYALDRAVAADLEPGASAQEVLDAITPAVSAQGTLTAAYSR